MNSVLFYFSTEGSAGFLSRMDLLKLEALNCFISSICLSSLLMTGDFISAETAVDYGLINHSVAPELLKPQTLALADKIAAKPQAARSVGKKLFYDQINLSLADAYALASEVMACNMMSPETVENVDAFLEKRPVR